MRLGSIALALLLAGCATPDRTPPTAVGQPAHTLTNVDVACVRGKLMRLVVDRGYVIRHSGDTQIVAGKITHNLGTSVLFTTREIDRPEERIMLTMAALAGDAVRVTLSGGHVSAPGTAFERVTPIAWSAEDAAALASSLDTIATQCRPKART